MKGRREEVREEFERLKIEKERILEEINSGVQMYGE